MGAAGRGYGTCRPAALNADSGEDRGATSGGGGSRTLMSTSRWLMARRVWPHVLVGASLPAAALFAGVLPSQLKSTLAVETSWRRLRRLPLVGVGISSRACAKIDGCLTAPSNRSSLPRACAWNRPGTSPDTPDSVTLAVRRPRYSVLSSSRQISFLVLGHQARARRVRGSRMCSIAAWKLTGSGSEGHS